MDAYTSFAAVYDMFMDDVPYRDWCVYISGLLAGFGIDDGLILDLGCGTGKLTRLMAEAGFDMIGVDSSEEMLNIAQGAEYENNHGILYLLQDMREFELYGTVRAVVSICDSVNYITDECDLLSVFKLVNNYLDPGGIFIFDINTFYKYSSILAENTFAENREAGSFIWENYFDSDTSINEYDLTLYIKEADDAYRRYEETHYQRAYRLDEMVSLIERAGLEFVASYDAFTKDPVREDSERVYVIARECTKNRQI
jgi:SAM-dependent methyltransferase